MKDSSQVFADNIRRYRTLRGLTQAQLAEAADITANYLSLIEGANKFPSPKVMDRLALALQVQPFELLIDLDASRSANGALTSTVQEFLSDISFQIAAFSKTLK